LNKNLTTEPSDYIDSSNNLLNNDILDFSDMETNKVEYIEFSLGEILKNIFKLFKEKIAKKGLVLRIINKSPSQRVIGDPIRLKKVFINVIDNAIKFTQDGIITINIAKINNHKENITLQFSIEDTGIGIREEAIPFLFESQADGSTIHKFGSTELGLVICKHLLNIMGGKIWLESKLDKGTIVHFVITFRINSHKGINEETAPQEFKSTLNKNQQDIKILLVEDNLINQKLVKLILTKKGFLVYVAGNGIEAIEMLEKNNFDIVFMDIQMPEMGGNEATKIIRENPKYAKLPIIAMTANTMKDNKEKSLEIGMNDYITKPIDTNKLFDTIIKWVN